jgi:anti-sigma factor RsiW
MSRCARARELFGPYWDDETTRAERDWLDAHFASCTACRAEYEELARTLGALGSLPRVEPAPDLPARALAAARAASAVPDVVFVRAPQRWVPATVAAAAVLAIAGAAAPFLMRAGDTGLFAHRAPAVAEPRLVATVTPPAATPSEAAPGATTGPALQTISDSLFDHSEDVDFVLDPVKLRQGRAHTASRLPRGVQGEQAVITF